MGPCGRGGPWAPLRPVWVHTSRGSRDLAAGLTAPACGGRGAGQRGAWASPACTHRGGAGATITGKAKAAVSLLGKYLRKPQEAAGWRAGSSTAPQAPGPPAGGHPSLHPLEAVHGGVPLWAGRGPCTQPGFVFRIINCAQSARALCSWTGHCSSLGCEMQFT